MSSSLDHHIKIPAAGFDRPIFAYRRWPGMFFIPYLRTCFAWGCFAGLAHQHEAAATAVLFR